MLAYFFISNYCINLCEESNHNFKMSMLWAMFLSFTIFVSKWQCCDAFSSIAEHCCIGWVKIDEGRIACAKY